MTPNTTAVRPWTDAEDCSECDAADESVCGVTDGADVRYLCWECYIEHAGETPADVGEDDTTAVIWRDVA